MVPESMITGLVKSTGKGKVKRYSDRALKRAHYKAMGRPIPEEWAIEDPMDLADSYYAVAKNAIYSNEARKRLSLGRSAIPAPEEQIEITRRLLERVK